MSEPIDVAIEAALYAHLRAPDIQAPATTVIAWPLVPLPSTPTGMYLDVKPLLRAEPEHFGVATGNSDILSGVFQVDVVTKADGAGGLPATRLAGLVKARFALNTRLPVNGRWLDVIAPPHIAAAITKDAPLLRFPVSIRFQLIT